MDAGILIAIIGAVASIIATISVPFIANYLQSKKFGECFAITMRPAFKERYNVLIAEDHTITADEWVHFEHDYEVYRSAGGNGLVQQWYEELLDKYSHQK